jgi:glycosyltransferase involved in cell wall biosynthesis
MPDTHLVFFCDPPYYGGAEAYVALLAEGRPPGWRLSALLPGDGGGEVLAEKLAAADVAVHRYVRRPWYAPRQWRELRVLLESTGGEILHMNLPSVYDACHTVPAVLAKSAGYHRVVTTEHLPMVPRARRHMLVKMVLSGAVDAAIVHTEWNRRRLASYHHLPSGKIVVIPNGSPAPPAMGAAERESFRAALGVRSDEVAIAVVARLTERKGHRYLLEALANVSRTGAMPGGEAAPWKLLVVGEGEEEDALRRMVAQLGLGEGVRFLGYRPDAVRIIQASDVLALSSLVESQPLVITEAMACGVPVVATAIYGIPEIVADGRTGLLVPPAEVAPLAEALRGLISGRELRERLSRTARERYEARFTLERMAERTYRVLRGNGAAGGGDVD